MALFIGLIGLPNVGKSSLFNALTQGEAEATNYPFCTIEPNIGVVNVPDGRLEQLAQVLQPAICLPTTIQFVDIAGLVQGASRNEGMGNQFLSQVREADALVHVVRCFEDGQIAHVEGAVDPVRDCATVETELALADLGQVEGAIDRLDTVVRTDPKSPRRLELEALQLAAQGLERGVPVRRQELTENHYQALQGYQLLTAKPVLLVANISAVEAQKEQAHQQKLAAAVGDKVVPVAVQVEAEIAQLDPQDQIEFRAEMGLGQGGLQALIGASFQLLGLITFYTVANDKLQAWQVPAGTLAPVAAGRIHSDMEDGFIRAEVASSQPLIEAGAWQALRGTGQVRTEGRDYVVADGDVVHFLFNT
ncbi:MAG: redox-regulated ATPase YchF [Candidatus Latescibacteria bacterium]|nr:redox-regulated ATPase YchF [Candidatus Latescibacterota bacterium]